MLKQVQISGRTNPLYILLSVLFAMSSSGTVKMWNDEKGFGFVTPEDGGEDLFVHRSALVECEALERDDVVKFDKEYDDRKGKERPHAI
jgi:CspA family cold shock protein